MSLASVGERQVRPEAVHPNGYDDLGAMLWDAMLSFREHTALIERDRKQTSQILSYEEVRLEAERLARRFESLGLKEGTRVAILMNNQPAWLISAMAVFYKGLVLVPLDVKLGAEEQYALLEHAQPALLITERHVYTKLDAVRREKDAAAFPGGLAVWVQDWITPTLPEGLARWDEPSDGQVPERVPRGREDLACLVYSSGTGGLPKGCLLPHRAYLSQLASLMELFPMDPDDRFFSVLPTNHAIDFLSGFIGPFASGATVVHQRQLRPAFLMDTLKTQGITQMAAVPMLLEAFDRALDTKLDEQKSWQKKGLKFLTRLNKLATAKRANHALSRVLLKPIHDGFGGKLKLIFAGGAFVEEKLARRFYDLGIPVYIGYGLTECTTVATLQDGRPFRADSVGRAVPGVEIKIHAPDAEGHGEVWIKGPTLMQGYLDEPELTAETLVMDEAGQGPWLRTGDIGWLDASQHLHLVGRVKNMIVTKGGKNIYPEDIELAYRSLGVDDFVIFSENYLWGSPKEGGLTEDRLVALVHHERFSQVKDEIIAINRSQPEARRIKGIVELPFAFPRTASMKIKRQALADQVREALSRDLVETI